MKLKYVATLVIALTTLVSNAQVKFEKGYIIFHKNNRVECLIRNGNWLRTPDQIAYRVSENGETTIATVNEIKEFGVGEVRFVAAEVEIDYSSKDPGRMEYNKHPVWVKAKHFLKVIVDGKASLYYFSQKDVERFFFKTESNDSIRQLIYKPYRVTGSSIKYNNAYQGQLTYEVACEGQKGSAGLEYKMTSLKNYFNRYNECRGGTAVEEIEHKRKSEFHLSITPGLDNSSFLTETPSEIVEYGDEKSARFGLEAEFVLPFNSRKWAIFLEPTYQTYETREPFAATIRSLELPAGARHYFYLSDNARIFINAAAVLDFPLEARVRYHRSIDPSQGSKTVTMCFAAGAGFKYSRFGLEARYYTARSRMDDSSGLFLVQKKLALILSVRVF